MRNIKTKITNIETALKNRNDVIFTGDYEKITSDMLLTSLNDMRTKVVELETIKDTFDFIFLKSQIDQILKDAKKKVEYKYQNLNDVILDIGKAKNLINEAYILYVKEEIRNEVELASQQQQLKEATEQLKEAIDYLIEFKDKKESIEDVISSMKNIANDANYFLEESSKKYDSICEIQVELEAGKDKCTVILKETEVSELEINEYKGILSDISNKINPLLEKSELLEVELKTTINNQKITIKEYNKNHDEQVKKVQLLTDAAKDVLNKANAAHGSANRAGLAFAYKEKREQFGIIKFLYMTVFLLSLGAIVYFNGETEFSFAKPEMLINKLLITLPLTIIAFLSGQYAYRASRSEEEYGHKEALSLSYEGLKQAVVDSENKSLSDKLLSQLVEAQGKNIAASMDKVYLTPIDKLLKDLPTAMNKLGVSEVTITEIISLLIQKRDDGKVLKVIPKASNDEVLSTEDSGR